MWFGSTFSSWLRQLPDRSHGYASEPLAIVAAWLSGIILCGPNFARCANWATLTRARLDPMAEKLAQGVEALFDAFLPSARRRPEHPLLPPIFIRGLEHSDLDLSLGCPPAGSNRQPSD